MSCKVVVCSTWVCTEITRDTDRYHHGDLKTLSEDIGRWGRVWLQSILSWRPGLSCTWWWLRPSSVTTINYHRKEATIPLCDLLYSTSGSTLTTMYSQSIDEKVTMKEGHSRVPPSLFQSNWDWRHNGPPSSPRCCWIFSWQEQHTWGLNSVWIRR